ncbi:MAG: hypothetical protein MUF80_05475, partial [Burkholderiales bacterium]|nr:hypothetical protein [Burkholderiales bacterium]
LLLFITRTERWFFQPPLPAAALLGAIIATQVLATLMCVLGWLVPAISWRAVGTIWAYNIAWMFILGAVRLATEKIVDHRTAPHLRSAEIVTQSLQPHVPASTTAARAR